MNSPSSDGHAVAGRMTDPNYIRAFIRAGDARFTLVSVKTGARFTYNVRDANGDGRMFWVSLLTDPDNVNGYSYFGHIYGRSGDFVHGKPEKARMTEDAPGAVAFRWFYENALAKRECLDQVEFYHEGRCSACGAVLTVPESIERGLGPVCAEKHGVV